MKEQYSRGQLIARAEEANTLLNGPVFSDALLAAEATFLKEWRVADSVERRELCWAKVAGLVQVRRQLSLSIGHGEIASHQPEER